MVTKALKLDWYRFKLHLFRALETRRGQDARGDMRGDINIKDSDIE